MRAGIFGSQRGGVAMIGRIPSKILQTLPASSSQRGAAAGHERLPDLSLAAYVLLPAAIFATSLLTIALSYRSNLVATLWPSNAIMLVVLLRHAQSFSNQGGILIVSSMANALASLVAGSSLQLAVVLSLANFVEVATAAVILRTFNIGAANFTSFRNLLAFMVIAGGLVPAASGMISAVAFAAAHAVPWSAIWRNWYPGHALGMIIIAPFLISVTSRDGLALLREKRRLAEAAAMLVFIVAVATGIGVFRSLIFITAPLILFATVRFGLVGATVATFVIAVIATIFVVSGVGQPVLTQPEPAERIFALQIFLAVTCFWALPTAALLAERDHLLHDLSRANSQLAAESERKSHLVVGLRRDLSMAEEKERLRLSHDLHDQAGQDLIAAILELNEIELTPGAARERLHSVRKKMEEMGKTLHRIAWELRPPLINELGLRRALASYIADWAEQCGTEVDFHCDDPRLDEVPNEIGTTIYRVVQEALTNVVKHAADASSVSIVIRRIDTTLQVIIEDNGRGFDVAAAATKAGYRGLGLDGMRERLMLIGGALEIESAHGTGTTIFARITLEGRRSAA